MPRAQQLPLAMLQHTVVTTQYINVQLRKLHQCSHHSCGNLGYLLMSDQAGACNTSSVDNPADNPPCSLDYSL